jgi:hypothetical protein
METEADPSGPSSARVPEKCGFSIVGGSSNGDLIRPQRQWSRFVACG